MTKGTEVLAKFVTDIGYEDIPKDVFEIARRQLLDTIGVALAGSKQQHGAIIRRMVKSWGGRRQATVWASHFRSAAPNAAFANGTFSHALDFDDYWQTLSQHPSGVLVPAVIAAAEVKKASGRELLTALVVGYEAAGKVGIAVNPEYERRWHPTPVIGTLAATAAVSNLLGLSELQVKMAIGMAASMAGGSGSHSGTMSKPLHSGLAARNGVMAAFLAKEGFTANENILDVHQGYFDAFFGGSYELDKAMDSLGRPYHLVSPGIGVKMYPSGWRLHHSFEATLAIVTQHDVKADQIMKVEIAVPRENYFNRTRIVTGLEGKFSIPYHASMAILDRKITIDSFTKKRALAADVQGLLQRIILYKDPSISSAEDKVFTQVTITLQNGQAYSQKVEFPRGHWRNQPTFQEVEAKFTSSARRALENERVKQIKEIVGRLEDLENMSQLTQALA